MGPIEPTRVKICGVTTPEDALAAVELGAALLGLNFYPPSPRSIDLEGARRISRAVAGKVPLVGVFVNLPRVEVEELATRVGLDLIQLHGDEGPEEAARYGSRAIKVFRRREMPREEELALYPDAWGFLFDVADERLYGGTGRSWAYDSAAFLPTGKPVLLSGGIDPDNAPLAAGVPGIWGIDVCSGVEGAKGKKDRKLLERLFREVRHGQGSVTA
jgi:phosphoribosylanthranilate isomerase